MSDTKQTTTTAIRRAWADWLGTTEGGRGAASETIRRAIEAAWGRWFWSHDRTLEVIVRDAVREALADRLASSADQAVREWLDENMAEIVAATVEANR